MFSWRDLSKFILCFDFDILKMSVLMPRGPY